MLVFLTHCNNCRTFLLRVLSLQTGLMVMSLGRNEIPACPYRRMLDLFSILHVPAEFIVSYATAPMTDCSLQSDCHHYVVDILTLSGMEKRILAAFKLEDLIIFQLGSERRKIFSWANTEGRCECRAAHVTWPYTTE